MTARRLLRAARFGMDFADVPSDAFTAMCQVTWILRKRANDSCRHSACCTTCACTRSASPSHTSSSRPCPSRHTHLRCCCAVDCRQVLIDRLINRSNYWLAFEICKYLKLNDSTATNRVLVHWASSMVIAVGCLVIISGLTLVQVMKQNAEDEAVAQTIIQKIGDTKGLRVEILVCIVNHALFQVFHTLRLHGQPLVMDANRLPSHCWTTKPAPPSRSRF